MPSIQTQQEVATPEFRDLWSQAYPVPTGGLWLHMHLPLYKESSWERQPKTPQQSSLRVRSLIYL